MGSNSTKSSKSTRSEDKLKDRSTRLDVSGRDDNVPDVLVSILRQKAVLVSEGISVSTQTEDTSFRITQKTDDPNFSIKNTIPLSTMMEDSNTASTRVKRVQSEKEDGISSVNGIETRDRMARVSNGDQCTKQNEREGSKTIAIIGSDKKDTNVNDSKADSKTLESQNNMKPGIELSQGESAREQSDMGTNTMVTRIPELSLDKQDGQKDVRSRGKHEFINENDPNPEQISTEKVAGTSINRGEIKHEHVTNDTPMNVNEQEYKHVSLNMVSNTPVKETIEEQGQTGSDVKQELGFRHSPANDGMLDDGTKNTTEAEQDADSVCLERYGKYRVRVESDKEKCTISAVTFLDTGDLVLIDRSNKNIKYVDSQFRYISAHNLPAQPWAVCARGVDVYVTIGNTQIQHLYVKDMIIETERVFDVKGRCLGICMYGEHIAVGLQIGEIHLLDTMGEKHKIIKLPHLDNGKPCNPWHLSVSNEQNILVTDSDAGTVFYINSDSQIVHKFCDMSSPRCATVDNHGNVIVVGRDMATGIVVTLVPRDLELGGLLHMEQGTSDTCNPLLSWRELEFVPYCVDFRDDGVVVLGGIRESLKIMKLKHK